MRLTFLVLLLGATLSAQTGAKGPLIGTSQAFFASAKNNILRSADKIPDNLWSYQPTPEVRTVAQMFAHIADGQYEFCGMASEGKIVTKDIEKNVKTKPEIVAAVKEAFSYCESAYDKMNDATATEMVDFFGRKVTRIGAMDFNIVHTMEHYGNLTTYMRINKIVPPSSAGR